MEKDKEGNSYFTAKDIPLLKKAWKKAVWEEKDSFLYEGKEIVTDYAKYVIEFMETQMKGK